jgi:hypothetical protein
MDMSGTVESLANTTLSVTRKGQPVLQANGRWLPGPTSSFSAVGVIYPSRQNEVLLLPEGRRGERAVTFISTTELKAPRAPGNASGGLSGDTFTYQGDRFDVLVASPWSEHGFFVNVAVRVGQ